MRFIMQARTLLRVSGSDARSFLNGLVTNDVGRIDQGLVYTALLTPQGKFVADFMMMADGDAVLLDVASSHGQLLATRLGLYKLRAKVDIAPDPRMVSRGIDDPPAGALSDPRHPSLGWRAYSRASGSGIDDWKARRVAHCIPETGIELTPDTYILEAGFERLNGVDFRKGCFIGQEIVARMHHKTELRKGLVVVKVDGNAPPVGTAITSDGRELGVLYTSAGDRAIAQLRLDRAGTEMQSGQARLAWDGTRWFS